MYFWGWLIEIAVNKYLEEVCSNVVELINYGDGKKNINKQRK